MFNDWTLLLYGTEDPAQPTDPKYSPIQTLYKSEGSSFGQTIAEQVCFNKLFFIKFFIKFSRNLKKNSHQILLWV